MFKNDFVKDKITGSDAPGGIIAKALKYIKVWTFCCTFKVLEAAIWSLASTQFEQEKIEFIYIYTRIKPL